MADGQDPSDRITRTIAALRQQGASEQDIEAYLVEHEGLHPVTTSPAFRAGHSKFTPAQLTARADRQVQNAQDDLDAEPGYLERLATHTLNAGQGIPGVERLEANVGALTTGRSSDEALALLRERTGEIGGVTSAVEKGLGALALAPVLPANAMGAGALYGGAQELAGADTESLPERATRTALGAGVGAATGYGLGKLADKTGATRAAMGRLATAANESGAADAVRAAIGVRPLSPLRQVSQFTVLPEPSVAPALTRAAGVAEPSPAITVPLTKAAARSQLEALLQKSSDEGAVGELVKGYPIKTDPATNWNLMQQVESGLLKAKGGGTPSVPRLRLAASP